MNILIIGDIVGKVGVDAVVKNLSNLKLKYNIGFTIVNAENSADGMGITKQIANDLYRCGVDVITMGNHTWGKKDIFSFIDEENRLVRPANYAEGLPGKGSTIIEANGKKIGVINLIGRINMGGTFDSPFTVADKEGLDMEEFELELIDYDVEEVERDEEDKTIFISAPFFSGFDYF